MHRLGAHLELRQMLERTIILWVQPKDPKTVEQPAAKDDEEGIHLDINAGVELK